MSSFLDQFFGTAPKWDPNPPGNPAELHQGGQDRIDPAFDSVHQDLLAGAIGFDPLDGYAPSLETREDIEQQLPQWGPPFIKFVDERISALEKSVIKELEKWQYQSTTEVFVAGPKTDGSGNINTSISDKAEIFSPPPGFTLALHRISLKNTANNFGTPFTAAGGYWELRVNEEFIDGGSLVSGQGSLPVVKTWGTRDAPRIRDGEVLSIFMNAGPASATIFIKGQGTYDRTIEG